MTTRERVKTVCPRCHREREVSAAQARYVERTGTFCIGCSNAVGRGGDPTKSVWPNCVACGVRPGTRPRGLCCKCHKNVAIRNATPTVKAPSNARGVGGNFYRAAPLPTTPTDEPPGSLAKMRVMHERAKRGEQLFHPLDNREVNGAPLDPFDGTRWAAGDGDGLADSGRACA